MVKQVFKILKFFFTLLCVIAALFFLYKSIFILYYTLKTLFISIGKFDNLNILNTIRENKKEKEKEIEKEIEGYLNQKIKQKLEYENRPLVKLFGSLAKPKNIFPFSLQSSSILPKGKNNPFLKFLKEKQVLLKERSMISKEILEIVGKLLPGHTATPLTIYTLNALLDNVNKKTVAIHLPETVSDIQKSISGLNELKTEIETAITDNKWDILQQLIGLS